MPELPEVESIVQALSPQVAGKAIRRVEMFDPRLLENVALPVFQEVLTGRVIDQVWRRGKFIIFTLGNGWRLTTHLRMTGHYLYFPQAAPPGKHTRLLISFADGCQLHYRDLRRFGRLGLYPAQVKIESLERLGPEPLGPDFTPRYLQDRIGRRKTPIKQLLLDQSIVAGIGNIYAAEILFVAAVSPFRPADQLGPLDFERLVAATRQVLNKAIQCLGTTFSDYRTSEGKKGKFQDCLQVYGRAGQACYRCGALIQRAAQAQRSTFYCPHCQA